MLSEKKLLHEKYSWESLPDLVKNLKFYVYPFRFIENIMEMYNNKFVYLVHVYLLICVTQLKIGSLNKSCFNIVLIVKLAWSPACQGYLQ